MTPAFVDVDWAGRRVAIEYAWVGRPDTGRDGDAPFVVFLHEGLGSLAMDHAFADRLCAAGGWRGLVYSRPGYGRSTPRGRGERWGADFLHRQAHEVLPAVLAAVGVSGSRRVWLFGHSDGGSIALLFAARFPQRVAGVVVVAPHIVVEAVSIASIEAARVAYEGGDLRARLARWHADPDSAFYGWNDAWLDPAFRDWSIEHDLEPIACPVLAVQGDNDAYGTLAQIRGIAERVPRTQCRVLPRCGHTPQRDAPDALIDATLTFIHDHGDPRP